MSAQVIVSTQLPDLESNKLSYAERVKLDLDLVRRRSLRRYVEILLRAAAEVCTGSNSW